MGQLKKEKFIATPLSKLRPAKCLLIIFAIFVADDRRYFFLVMVDKNGVSSRPIKIIISAIKIMFNKGRGEASLPVWPTL